MSFQHPKRRVHPSEKSLQKAMRILLHLGRFGPELSLAQLSSSLAMNRSTVYRLLRAMQNFHFIEENRDGGTFRIGIKFP